jgi:hypothetical protein
VEADQVGDVVTAPWSDGVSFACQQEQGILIFLYSKSLDHIQDSLIFLFLG